MARAHPNGARCRHRALNVALGMCEHGAAGNDLLDRLDVDERLPLDRVELGALVGEPISFVGTAVAQVDAFVPQVPRWWPATPRPPPTAQSRSCSEIRRLRDRAMPGVGCLCSPRSTAVPEWDETGT